MCKMGAIMLTLLHEGDYKTQTYLLMTLGRLPSNLRLESLWGFAQIGRE